MPYSSWEDAVKEIRETTGPATEMQKRLASAAGILFPPLLPRLVAAAKLKFALRKDLDLPNPKPCSAGLTEFVKGLETDDDKVEPTPENDQEVRAWLLHLRLRHRLAALELLRLESGDIVENSACGSVVFEKVSSIGANGRVYFKGGAGAGAWPDTLKLSFKKDAVGKDAEDARRMAENQVACRVRCISWSEIKHQELKKCEVLNGIEETDIEELSEVINAAEDERPIQEFLQSRPQILGALLGGQWRFCLPQVRLGAEYVADFLLGSADSLGIKWVLLELETPRSNVTLQRENMLEEHARKGVSQIGEWREWIQNNLAYARGKKNSDGLGLVDIRPQSEGLVLVGSRSRLRDNNAAIRHRTREEQNIRVHTYDWLLDQLRGGLAYDGPPGCSPYTIQPDL